MTNSNSIDIEEINDSYISALANELNTLKWELQEIENSDYGVEKKKEETEKLNEKIEELTKKIEDSIKVLEDSINDPSNTDDPKQDERAAYKEQLEKLQNETVKDITELRNSILSAREDKWFFWNAWNWIWEQWDDIWDWDKWKNETWKNLLRTAWFVATWVWAISLLYKWIKELFWWWSEREEDDRSKKKSSWWKKWLAVVWIWVAGVFWYKYRDEIKHRFKDVLWLNEYEEQFESHFNEVKSFLESQESIKTYWFDWPLNEAKSDLSFNETTSEIISYGQKTKIDKEKWKIEWLDMRFPDSKTMIIIANRINYMKYAYQWHCISDMPFYSPESDISIELFLKNPDTWEQVASNENFVWWFNLFGWIYWERIPNEDPDNPTPQEHDFKIEYMKIWDTVVDPKVYTAPYCNSAYIESCLENLWLEKTFLNYFLSHREKIVDYLNNQTWWASN